MVTTLKAIHLVEILQIKDWPHSKHSRKQIL